MESTDFRNKNARLILLLYLISILGQLLLFIPSLEICSIYLVHPVLIVSAWVSIRFLRGAVFDKRFDTIFLIVSGVIYNLGAHLSDLLFAYLFIPTLEREGNPIIRLLLDQANASLGFVYFYGITAKTLFGIVQSLLWIGLVGHRYAILDSIAVLKDKGLLTYLRSAIGGSHQNWRSFFIPLKLKELPRAFNVAFFLTLLFIATNFYIWSMWAIPHKYHWHILILGEIAFFLAYLDWLSGWYYKISNPVLKARMIKRIVIIGGIVALLLTIATSIAYIKFLKATGRMKELSADLEKRIVEWEKKEYRRPPLFGLAIPGNAAEYYQQAESQMTELMKDSIAYIQWSDYVDDWEGGKGTHPIFYEPYFY